MKYGMLTKQKVFFIWWAAGMLHIVCILELYLTYGTWHNWVTQNCTQGFAGPCICSPSRYGHNRDTARDGWPAAGVHAEGVQLQEGGEEARAPR